MLVFLPVNLYISLDEPLLNSTINKDSTIKVYSRQKAEATKLHYDQSLKSVKCVGIKTVCL